ETSPREGAWQPTVRERLDGRPVQRLRTAPHILSMRRAMVVAAVAWTALATADESAPVAHSYYASPTGSDKAGDGSLAAPWATVPYATSRMIPGDTLYLRGGTYPGQSVIATAGAPGAPLSVVAYPNEVPTLVARAIAPGTDIDTLRVLT